MGWDRRPDVSPYAARSGPTDLVLRTRREIEGRAFGQPVQLDRPITDWGVVLVVKDAELGG